MTIGLAFLWWFIVLMASVVFFAVGAVVSEHLLNDFLDFMLMAFVYVVSLLLQLSLVLILVWWIYAMISQGINPIGALSYTMW